MSKKRTRPNHPPESATGSDSHTSADSARAGVSPTSSASGSREPRSTRKGERRALALFENIAPFPRAFWILFALAAVLRFVWMNQEGVWADEVYVYNDCLRPFADKLRTVHIAHFLLGQFFLGVWDSVGALRLMTVLWGLATFPIFHDLAARLVGRRGAILATALLAISSYHITYSLDANYYAPVIFFATAGLWLAARYVENAHPVDLFLSLAALAAGFLFHPFAGVLAASTVLTLLLVVAVDRRHRELLWPPRWWNARQEGWAVLIAAIEIIVILGVVFVFLPRAKSMARMAFDGIHLGSTPRNYIFIPDLFYDCFRGILADYPLSSRLPWSFGWAAVVVAGVGVAASIRRRPWIAALFFGPVVLSFVVIANLKANHHFYVRYFSYLFPALSLYLIWGAMQLAAWSRGATGSRADDNGAPALRNSKDSRESDAPLAKSLLAQGRAWAAWLVVAVYAVGIVLSLVMKWTEPDAATWIAWILGLVLFVACAPIPALSLRLDARAFATVIVGIFILVNAATVGNRFVVRGGQNWNAALDELREHAKPGQLIVYEYPQEGEMLRYNLPRIGLSFRDTLKLPEANQFPHTRVAQMQGMARAHSDFWLLRSWNINSPAMLNPWARAHLRTAVDAPSNFEPFLDVLLFRGDVKGRYLLSPYGVETAYDEKEKSGAVSDSAAAAARWERVIDVEVPTTVALRIVNAAALGEGARVRPSVDGDAVGEWIPADAVSAPIAVSAGKHKLDVGVEPGKDSSASASVATPPVALWSSLDLPGGIAFPATRLSLPFPTFCEQSVFEGRPVLRLIRNLGVQYWFQFPAAGTYEFRIEAVHDKPRPVWLDVAVDGAFQGIVNFDRLDNAWGEKSMPIQIDSAGWHSIAINLVSAGEAAWNLKEDEETNAILGTLSLRRATDAAPARDDRSGPRDARLPKTTMIPVVDVSGSKALPGWTIEGAPGGVTVVANRPIALRPEPAVEIEIPAESGGVNLISPPIPCRPGVAAIHAEAVLGTFDLINHSVSLGLRFFNASNQRLQGTVPIGQEGMYRTNDGHRFAVVRGVPPGAARCALVVTVYPNGARPAKTPGWVRVGGVGIGEQ